MKEKIEFNAAIHAEQLHDFITEASDAKTIMEAASDTFNEIKKRAAEELGVDSAEFNKLFTMYHKGTRDEFENQTSELLIKYDAVFKVK